MSRALDSRVQRLEQQTQATGGPTWEQAHEALERLQDHARGVMIATLHDWEPPSRDRAQSQGDAATLVHWCATQRVPVDWGSARARLGTRLATLAARHAAEEGELR